MPGTLKLGHGGEAHIGWTETPRIVLDLELRPTGVTVYFALTLSALSASVEVNYVAFEKPEPDPQKNTAFLEAAARQSPHPQDRAARPLRQSYSIRPMRSALAIACMRLTASSFCVVW